MNKQQYFIVLGVLILIMSVITFWYLRNIKEPIESPVSTEMEWVLEHTSSTPETTQGEVPTGATTTPLVEEVVSLPEKPAPETGATSSKISLPENTPMGFDTTAMILAHNTARAEVGTLPLIWSETLARSAQTWSDTLKTEACVFRHDPDTGYGENIYWAWRTNTDNSSLISKPEDALDWWVNEVNFYNYEKNTCKEGEQCGHYTQVVWKETREVGCGVSTCFDNGKQTDVWVCRYNPAGNDGMRPY